MLISLLLNFVVLVLGTVFSWLPRVETLPTVVGFDIDSALVTGMGQLRVFTETFWVYWVLIQGFTALLAYYGGKAILRFFFGHRTPVN